MLHTRTEVIKNKSLNDEAEEDKGNNDFSDFIIKKDSNNIIIGFYGIVPTIQESALILHKAQTIKSKAFKRIISYKLYF